MKRWGVLVWVDTEVDAEDAFAAEVIVQEEAAQKYPDTRIIVKAYMELPA